MTGDYGFGAPCCCVVDNEIVNEISLEETYWIALRISQSGQIDCIVFCLKSLALGHSTGNLYSGSGATPWRGSSPRLVDLSHRLGSQPHGLACMDNLTKLAVCKDSCPSM